MTDTRELVERLKVVARCGTDSTMRHSAYAFMTQDPDGDYVTYSAYAALSERVRVLEEAVEAVIQFHNSTFSGPCAAQNRGRAWKGALRKCLNARAALASGGRG